MRVEDVSAARLPCAPPLVASVGRVVGGSHCVPPSLCAHNKGACKKMEGPRNTALTAAICLSSSLPG